MTTNIFPLFSLISYIEVIFFFWLNLYRFFTTLDVPNPTDILMNSYLKPPFSLQKLALKLSFLMSSLLENWKYVVLFFYLKGRRAPEVHKKSFPKIPLFEGQQWPQFYNCQKVPLFTLYIYGPIVGINRFI